MLDKKGSGVAYGIIIGTVIGAITGDLGLWLALGVALGAGWEVKSAKSRLKSDPDQAE